MSIFSTNWFRNAFGTKQEETPCKQNGDCLKNLQLIMDGEASEEEQREFTKHIEECMPCYRHYNLEKTIKQVLKAKCTNVAVPAELIESIKSKIRESV
jgi:anti-sigma factor (TIGR02949 family)